MAGIRITKKALIGPTNQRPRDSTTSSLQELLGRVHNGKSPPKNPPKSVPKFPPKSPPISPPKSFKLQKSTNWYLGSDEDTQPDDISDSNLCNSTLKDNTVLELSVEEMESGDVVFEKVKENDLKTSESSILHSQASVQQRFSNSQANQASDQASNQEFTQESNLASSQKADLVSDQSFENSSERAWNKTSDQ